MQNRCFILRGLPGSGKSYQVETLKELHPDTVVCSADDFFIKEDGSYERVPALIGVAHQQCQKKFFDAISQGMANVVVDNTNSRLWEFENYIQQAVFFGYKILIVDLKPKDMQQALCMIRRNVHEVPEEVGISMFERWEDNPAGFQVFAPDPGI